ncbi:MAG: winged helix-turn-helix domain-containing protein, partial [Propionibacteriaceae bacterium]|nr:winged helix-turn-helix domain-containing protein [Propionibacteriaceae bacterium]
MANLSNQLQKQLLQLIDSELAPGQQLPSEPELAAYFKASRSSVREALRGLELDGVVYAVQGKGRFVSQLGV